MFHGYSPFKNAAIWTLRDCVPSIHRKNGRKTVDRHKRKKKTFQVHQPQKKHDTKHSKYMEVVSISASPKTLKGHSRYSLERFGTVSLNPLKNHGSMRCGDF